MHIVQFTYWHTLNNLILLFRRKWIPLGSQAHPLRIQFVLSVQQARKIESSLLPKLGVPRSHHDQWFSFSATREGDLQLVAGNWPTFGQKTSSYVGPFYAVWWIWPQNQRHLQVHLNAIYTHNKMIVILHLSSAPITGMAQNLYVAQSRCIAIEMLAYWIRYTQG